MNGIKWLHCVASQGQFKDEYGVHGKDYENVVFSLFTLRYSSRRSIGRLSDAAHRIAKLRLDH
jgi:hypothetical protein